LASGGTIFFTSAAVSWPEYSLATPSRIPRLFPQEKIKKTRATRSAIPPRTPPAIPPMVPTGSALDELDDDDALLPEPPVLDDAKPLVVVEA
jgi:hypothetical protein